jgi:hypothetical protein
MTLLVAQDLSWMLALFQVVIGCKGQNSHTEMEESWCDSGDHKTKIEECLEDSSLVDRI